MDNTPQQSAKEFFSRTDVRALQDIQKAHAYGSKEHHAAFLKVCELAAAIGAAAYISPDDY